MTAGTVLLAVMGAWILWLLIKLVVARQKPSIEDEAFSAINPSPEILATLLRGWTDQTLKGYPSNREDHLGYQAAATIEQLTNALNGAPEEYEKTRIVARRTLDLVKQKGLVSELDPFCVEWLELNPPRSRLAGR